MRTLDLIKAFSAGELQEISAIISENKRPGIVRLFKGLTEAMHREEEPDNARLYKKVFGESYVKEKDYLLRNELRLLNEILYRFLAEKTALIHLDKYKRTFNFWLCNGYYERGLHNLLRSDIDDFINENNLSKMSQESMSMTDATSMMSLKSLWMIETQPKIASNIQQQLDVLKQWQQQEKMRFLYRLREIEAREAYLNKEMARATGVLSALREDMRTPGETLIDLGGSDNEEPLIKYTLLKKHAFQTMGDTRIEVLKETLKLLESDNAIEVLGLRARFSALNQLGMEYILTGRHEEGNKYLEQYIKECIDQKWVLTYSMIHNYMVNQINLEAYEKGIEIYQRYKQQIESNLLKNPGRVFLAYFHLYLGNGDEAIKLIPKESELTIPMQIISRFIYTISFLMRKEYALAVSEIKNLRRTVKAIKSGDYSKQLLIIDLYLRYASAHTKQKEDRNKIVSELKNEMESNEKQWRIIATVDVQLYWLMKKLKD